jgi:predicted flap endonuclease-1-like 5' DNA nuclease
MNSQQASLEGLPTESPIAPSAQTAVTCISLIQQIPPRQMPASPVRFSVRSQKMRVVSFSEVEKSTLLRVKGVGPKVIERLEPKGFSTLQQLAVAYSRDILAPFGRWTLRNKAAKRRLALL